MTIRRGTVLAVHDAEIDVGIGPEFCLACAAERCAVNRRTIRAHCPRGIACSPGDVVEVAADRRATSRALRRLVLYPVLAGGVVAPFSWGGAAAVAAVVVAAAVAAGRGGEELPVVTSVSDATTQLST